MRYLLLAAILLTSCVQEHEKGHTNKGEYVREIHLKKGEKFVASGGGDYTILIVVDSAGVYHRYIDNSGQGTFEETYRFYPHPDDIKKDKTY